jgi:hypothetical protein
LKHKASKKLSNKFLQEKIFGEYKSAEELLKRRSRQLEETYGSLASDTKESSKKLSNTGYKLFRTVVGMDSKEFKEYLKTLEKEDLQQITKYIDAEISRLTSDRKAKLSKIDKFTIEPVRIQNKRGMDTSAHVYTVPQQIWFEQNRPDNTNKMTHLSIKNVPGLGATYYFADNTQAGNSNTTDLVNSGLTNFNGYTCEIGLKSLYIDYNGKVFAGNCCVGGPLGSINDPDDIAWPTTPIKCNVNLCHCDTDVIINKWIN